MKRAILAASLLALVATASTAAHADPRLVSRLYDPGQIVRIEGKINVQATIQFGEDETIENVAIGDSLKWQVTPNRRANLLFIKPLAERASTNMTVVTDKHTYLFDLVSSSAHRTPLYVLSFTYPEEVEPAQSADAAGQPAERANALEMAAATDPYAVLDPAALNFAWISSGSRSLLPERVFDDGEATFLTWPPGTKMPAILVKDHEGAEGPVNFAVRGDVIVVDGVPSEFVLRAGNETARLVNEGPARPVRASASALAQTRMQTESDQ